MKRSLALMAMVMAACGEPKLPDLPVDMQFRVSVEELENGCDSTSNYKPEEGYTTLVDVFLRSDGTVNVSNDSAYVPGRSKYENIVLKDGRIDHKMQVESTNGNLEHSLRGIVAPDRMDVTLTTQEWSWSSGSAKPCQRKTRLKGNARPLLDPNTLDGDYKVHVEDYGFSCPGIVRTKQSEGTVMLTADQYMGSRANFTLNGQLAWGADVPGEDGLMEWSGSLFIQQFFELQGSVKGVFKPDDVDMTMDFGEIGDTTGCTSQLFIKGAKRIPSASSVDNDYRLAFGMNDGCGIGLESSESTAQLIMQNDGKVALVDPYLGTLVTLKDGVLSYSAGSEAEGEVLTLTGSSAPPHLDYSVEYKAEMSPGTWCSVTYSASGQARYVFE